VRTRLERTGDTSAQRVSPGSTEFDALLARISEGAAQRDADPAFPEEPFRALAAASLLAMPVPDPIGARGRRASFSEEWQVLRAVAAADSSVGRIFDGHLNGVERLAALAPEPLRSRELEAVVTGELLLGVWGADPVPGEGKPACLVETETGPVLEGVKTFCSGSTGLHRALVAVRATDGAPGPPLLAYVDLTRGGVEVDRSWFRGFGMRSSESHRVVFQGARVLAILGDAGELIQEPYFARDAVRTAVTWAGIADLAMDTALGILASKSAGREPDEIVSLAAGRMLAARDTMDCWLEHAARQADEDPEAVARELLDVSACDGRRVLPGDPGRGRARVRLAPLRGRLPARPRPARPGAFTFATPPRTALARAGREAMTEHRSRS
jgi:alkylation response protein AidB-like acyl-CoA dehydrogenase